MEYEIFGKQNLSFLKDAMRYRAHVLICIVCMKFDWKIPKMTNIVKQNK